MILTRDMVPIHIGNESCSFVCPLPRGYKRSLRQFTYEELNGELKKIISTINMLANQETGPFVNIMIEYQNRVFEEKEELRESFLIERIGIDKRGLYMALAGRDVNSGDIYLDEDASPCCDFSIMELERFFEEGFAFQCHNVDFYWQALLLRELSVEYFNLINKFKDQRWI